jgi:hypothetical protein
MSTIGIGWCTTTTSTPPTILYFSMLEKKKENDCLRLGFLMNCLLVFQQYYFVDDLVVVIELVLQLVEQDDYVIYDFLAFDMDHVHRYTRLKRKSLHLEIIKITSRVV